MAKHRFKAKKVATGEQLRWGLILLEGVERCNEVLRRQGKPEYFPPSHHAEDREGWCGPCGHPFAWHDNVWFKVDEDCNVHSAQIRCRGGYPVGLSVTACNCRETYA